MQVAQTAQERMKRCLKRRACTRPLAALIVAALKVGASAECLASAGENEATNVVALLVDRIHRLGETGEHVQRHRVHDLRMIEYKCGDRSVEFQSAMFELHAFLA